MQHARGGRAVQDLPRHQRVRQGGSMAPRDHAHHDASRGGQGAQGRVHLQAEERLPHDGRVLPVVSVLVQGPLHQGGPRPCVVSLSDRLHQQPLHVQDCRRRIPGGVHCPRAAERRGRTGHQHRRAGELHRASAWVQGRAVSGPSRPPDADGRPAVRRPDRCEGDGRCGLRSNGCSRRDSVQGSVAADEGRARPSAVAPHSP